MILKDQIRYDLKESQITWKIAFLFIPIAFLTYIFYEFGHMILGEFLGDNMTMSLNNSAPKSGYFQNETHALWSAIGGPLFTLIQAIIFILVAWMSKSIYAYSFAFFAIFSRIFSIVFGGVALQDEARIASISGINMYIVAAIVLAVLILFCLLLNRAMKLNLKAVGYYSVLSTFAMLIVIGVDKLLK